MNEYRKLRLIAENAARDTLRKMNESRANRIIESEVRRCFESLEDLDDAPNPSYISDEDWDGMKKRVKNGFKKGIKKGGSYIKKGLKKAKKFMNDEFEKADSAENPTYFEESIRRNVKRVLREMEDTEYAFHKASLSGEDDPEMGKIADAIYDKFSHNEMDVQEVIDAVLDYGVDYSDDEESVIPQSCHKLGTSNDGRFILTYGSFTGTYDVWEKM